MDKINFPAASLALGLMALIGVLALKGTPVVAVAAVGAFGVLVQAFVAKVQK